jgi:hypothetical protein
VTALGRTQHQPARGEHPAVLGMDGAAGVYAVDLSPLDEEPADGQEILETRWFTRAELSQRAASGRPLGRVDSIDSHLLQSWLDLA